jgi:hypothetical protein
MGETKPVENWTKAVEGGRADRDVFEVDEGLSVLAYVQEKDQPLIFLPVCTSQ